MWRERSECHATASAMAKIEFLFTPIKQMSNTGTTCGNILRYISLMSPTAETYRKICSQIYAKRAPTTFSTDALRMRHAFRTLRHRIEDNILVYYYTLPNGRCDGAHIFAYDGAVRARYYCCNGTPHGAYVSRNQYANTKYTTIVHGLFDGPIKFVRDGVTIRTGTYNNGYLYGEFSGSPLMDDALSSVCDVMSTYAHIYGPGIWVPDLCNHGYDTPATMNSRYTKEYNHTIKLAYPDPPINFSGGILTGPIRFTTSFGTRVECNFEQGMLHGALTAYRSDTLVRSTIYNMGRAIIP